jgi:choline-sulfatase/uncharacterized sulfatase
VKRYNVLMVLADQHNATLLGSAGHPQVHTPTFDRFAGEGVRFTNAYAQNTICTPSRVSILSGQYCHNHGYYGLSGPAKPGLDNLFRHFRRNGYRTAGYGKLHLPNSPRNWVADDVDQFGDTYETADGEIGSSAFFDYLAERGLRRYEDSWHNRDEYGTGTISHDAMPSRLPYEHTQERWCADRAMEFMEHSGDVPFFVQVAFQKPHHPLLPSPRFWEMYPEDIHLPETAHAEPAGRPPHFRAMWEQFQNRKWDYGIDGEPTEAGARRAWRGTLACITQIDDVFSRLLAFLEETGRAEDTIVIYSSDHGAYHGIHGIEEKAPGICSDAVCRVPMIWRVPRFTRPGAVVHDLVEAVDLAATLPGLCGIPPMESADGLDIAPLLAGSAPPAADGVAVTENPFAKAIRWRNWRMVYYPHAMFGGEEYGELYDLAADPNERTNLYSHRPQVVRDGMRRLADWLITTTRVVTTHPAVRTDRIAGRETPGARTYPLLSDGTAPNPVQPRHRDDNSLNYL